MCDSYKNKNGTYQMKSSHTIVFSFTSKHLLMPAINGDMNMHMTSYIYLIILLVGFIFNICSSIISSSFSSQCITIQKSLECLRLGTRISNMNHFVLNFKPFWNLNSQSWFQTLYKDLPESACMVVEFWKRLLAQPNLQLYFKINQTDYNRVKSHLHTVLDDLENWTLAIKVHSTLLE